MGIACIFRHTKSVIFIVFILNCLIIFSNVVLARVTSNTDGWYESGSLPFLNRQKRQTIANCSSLVRTNGSCWIPSNENGRRIQVQCSGSVHDQDPLYRAASGMYVRRLTLLSVNCESGYILNDDDYQQSICYNEEWVPPLPSCSKLCPKLTVQDGMKLECSYKGAKIDCDGAIRPTVKVYPECRYSYLKAEDNLTYEYITCKSNGEWDAKLFTCIPDCGRPYTPTQTLIAGGKTADISDSPWNVGIYDHHRNDTLICGGTIISPHLIISAAHCFYNESNQSKNSVDNYEIVVAKFTRNKNVVDNPYQKFYKLKNIYIHKNYVGSISYHANNIAILETFIPMRFSALVLPACINWATGHAQNDLVAGVPGKVVGWGLDSSGKISDVLNVGILPYIPYKQCIQNFPNIYRKLITVGTFCAGEEEFGPSLRQGDSGAGLLFRRNDDRYYLYGLVSSRQSNLNTSLFTDIYDHIEWISGIRNAIEKRGISDVDTLNNPKTVSIAKTPPVTAIESSIYKQAVPLSVDESKTCHVPPVSPGRTCSINCRGAISDCSFPGAQLRLSCTCGRNYTLSSTKINEAYCADGIWFPTVPECLPLCPILKSTMLNFVSCSNGSSSVSCTEPAKPGTIVRIECKPNYVPVEPSSVVRSVVCGDNGMWDSPLYKCRPECGLPYPGTVPLISEGRPAKPHEAPWHVAVYLKVNSNAEVRYRYICGGTIISPFLIVSAAHCFTDPTTNEKLPVENFKIAVAKVTVRYNISDDPETRIFGVTELYIPDDYYGEDGSYASDIALVELDGIIKMSNKVMPICIDWSPPENSKPPDIGTIAGWGSTNNETTSDVLLMAQLPFIPHNKCRQMVQPTFVRFISIVDKFCSGSLSGPGARPGDSGGGWIYERNGHYFVYGIVSFKEISSTSSIATFTRIPFHLDWMERIKREVELPETVSRTKTPSVTAIKSSTNKQDVQVDESKTCHVPPVSPGRTCSINCRGAISDCSFPGAQLRLSCTCDRNHTLSSTKINETYCIDGIWFPTVPECIPLCPILKSTMLNFFGCSNGSSSVSCTEPAKPGTIVRIECKPNYTPVDPSLVVRSVVCGDNGMWDRPLYKCRPECGLPYPGIVPLISEGRPTKPHEAPWHVAVYRKVNSAAEFKYICGGTIISPFLIVSAAHCFTDTATNVKLPVENFKIAVAKMTVRYNISDDPETRIFGVTELYIPDNYYGELGSYASDIALVELDGIIKMSNKVMPICIDRSPPANSKPADIGTVAGWGLTNNETISDVLLMAQLPFIPHNKCRQMVQLTFIRFISPADKFCSGSKSGPGARQGDSGGGWMYERNGHYFVYGIVSFRDTSSASSVATFTGIPFHLDWMEGIKSEVERRRGH